MCELCSKEWQSKERRRKAYAKKRQVAGRIATRRLTKEQRQSVALGLWLANGQLWPEERKHLDLG